MNVLHLTDSPFFGGPERQMLGLAVTLGPPVRTTIACFREPPLCLPFIERLSNAGVVARMLPSADPRFDLVVRDVIAEIREQAIDVLLCHGYKADILGLIAGRLAGVSVASVSRGWTGHTRKVRLFESIDRRVLRLMDAVVCVSEGQAVKVRRSGVSAEHVHVIHNAIDPARFEGVDPGARSLLDALFPTPRATIVLAVGRLSPEKGFDQLVEAARLVARDEPSTGFVIVGDGPDRQTLEAHVREAGLAQHVVIAGFRADVDTLMRGADVLAQSSWTEGLPNVVLEASAAGVPVVATAVGGTGEVIEHGVNGYLVSPGAPVELAQRLMELISMGERRKELGAQGREVVATRFSFEKQGARYAELFDRLVASRPPRPQKRRLQAIGDAVPALPHSSQTVSS